MTGSGVTRQPTPKNTLAERIARYLMEHPGSSTWEMAVDLRIANVTARMSDLRVNGYDFEKWRDDKGVYRYRIVTPAGTFGL